MSGMLLILLNPPMELYDEGYAYLMREVMLILDPFGRFGSNAPYQLGHLSAGLEDEIVQT